MAIPLIAGLPWLASVLAGLLGSLVAWFAQWMTRRLAVTLVIIGVFLSLTAAFYASVLGVINLLSVSVPSSISASMGMFLPSNAPECITAILATYTARWVYDVQLRVLSYKNLGAGF